VKRSVATALIALAWLVLLLPSVHAQTSPGLTVTPLNGDTVTAARLVDELVGTGVATSNETYTDPSAPQAAGLFSGGTGIIGFESGVLLTSGDVDNVVGPNMFDDAGMDNSVPGDADLDVLAGGATLDAAVLEFTFVPDETTVTFRYAFGSEEYNEYVYGGFNDVFGFFVNDQNCATVPDPTEPQATVPVSIDTVNVGNPGLPEQPASNPALYRNNDLDDGGGAIDTELDGLTVVLTCTAAVNPGVNNQAKLAIADVGDGGYDSAVFLETGSFSSEQVTHNLSVTTSGDGDGVVTSSDGGINCDSTIGDPELTDCFEVYDEGTDVTLTATPNEGSTFVQWTGCDSTEGNTCFVTMNDERTVNAEFGLPSEETADLAVAKSDTGPGFGPETVSSGGVVAYQVSVSNGGTDAATGVTVTDTATNGTVQSGSGTNWTCGDPSENTLTCTYDVTLASGETAEPLRVLVKAPTSSADTTMTDEATVTGDQTDPDPENNTDGEATPVTGTGSPAARDHAATFFDGETTTTLQTTRDTVGRFFSKLIIPGNSGLLAGPVSIDEFDAALPQFDGFCGGRDCDAQVQITVLPEGETPSNNPIQVFWFYVKGNKQGSTLYVKGDDENVATVVRNCLTPGIADPPKCVRSRTILANGDRQFLQVWRNGGDPGGGKR
jgi:uncharacterized repeat protein (TIGR01451 family)